MRGPRGLPPKCRRTNRENLPPVNSATKPLTAQHFRHFTQVQAASLQCGSRVLDSQAAQHSGAGRTGSISP